MQFKTFYNFTDDDKYSSSDETLMELSHVYGELCGRLRTDEDFLGLIDADGTVLQVAYHTKDDSYWVEIPFPSEKGSYGKSYGFDGFLELMKSLPEKFSLEGFPQFGFQPWG